MTASMTDAIRIAMWSGPRNISTAMMRSFENRPDTLVIDEPFYACYLKETGREHPGRELILKEQPTHWQAVVDDLLAPLPADRTILYQKHMSHHMLPTMGRDWMAHIRNAFLIRDPRLMVRSYAKARAEVSLEDLGVRQELEIFREVADRLGTPPPVIDSAEVLAAPKEKLAVLCASLGIPFHAAMLSWPRGPRPSDGVWAPWWYKGVEVSTGFAPPEGADEDGEIALPDHLQRIADQAMPAYDELKQYAL